VSDIEVYHQDDQWHVRRQGQTQTLSDHDTKDEAVAAGREVAEADGVELVIKKLDGTIGKKDSHGNDPRNIPG
jgi:hypothetical protein